MMGSRVRVTQAAPPSFRRKLLSAGIVRGEGWDGSELAGRESSLARSTMARQCRLAEVLGEAERDEDPGMAAGDGDPGPDASTKRGRRETLVPVEQGAQRPGNEGHASFLAHGPSMLAAPG